MHVLRGGRTYSLNHLDMEVKLNLILKELQDLKLRVYGLKSKSNEGTLENRNDRRKDESTSTTKMKMT